MAPVRSAFGSWALTAAIQAVDLLLSTAKIGLIPSEVFRYQDDRRIGHVLVNRTRPMQSRNVGHFEVMRLGDDADIWLSQQRQLFQQIEDFLVREPRADVISNASAQLGWRPSQSLWTQWPD